MPDPSPAVAMTAPAAMDDIPDAVETVGIADTGDSPDTGDTARFSVRLSNFEGPFDLLLSLIGKRQLDVTEVALSQVTDEFIGYITAAGAEWDLGEATEFLVIAATLLDLKAARLLPAAEVEDEEDLALLEARDLLFARLLQYRAYKQVAAYFAELERTQSRRFAREVPVEPRFADLIPEVVVGVGLDIFAQIAARALTPRPVPTVSIDHVHTVRVSVAEHMGIMRARLRGAGTATFRSLTEDCTATIEVVARFLGLLEMYRQGEVAFDQAAALSELRVRWTAAAQPSEEHDAGPEATPPGGGAGERDIDEEYG